MFVIQDESGEDNDSSVEKVSSEEEEEAKDNKDKEEPKKKPAKKTEKKTAESKASEKAELSGRSVELKQNGKGIRFEDMIKEDGKVIKEVLQNMTIKIDNVKDSDKGESKDTTTKRRSSKDKRDKGDSGKSKSKSSSHKDIKDINERLKAQASYGEDVELDYDDIHYEGGKDKQTSDGEIESSVSWKIVFLEV